MARLPVPGSDDGTWGNILNQYLKVSLNADGTLKPAAVSLASYGQLSISSQNILFMNDNDWLPIPFNTTGPSSDMDVSTTSPATITIQRAGVYQVNFSLYFEVEHSDEDTFDITTYTFGLSVNGTTTPAAAVYASDPGHFQLNYNNVMELSASDTVQFYMEASAADPPPFANIVTLQNGNAYVMQISN